MKWEQLETILYFLGFRIYHIYNDSISNFKWHECLAFETIQLFPFCSFDIESLDIFSNNCWNGISVSESLDFGFRVFKQRTSE